MSLADIGQDVGMLDHGIRFLQETGQSLMFAEQTGGNTSCKLLYFCFKSSKIYLIKYRETFYCRINIEFCINIPIRIGGQDVLNDNTLCHTNELPQTFIFLYYWSMWDALIRSSCRKCVSKDYFRCNTLLDHYILIYNHWYSSSLYGLYRKRRPGD